MRRSSFFLAVILSTILSARPALAEDNGVALSPPMGWSSWSFVREHPTEQNIEAQADALKSTGLSAHGYQYVNIDDFYYLDPAKTVDDFGRWVIDAKKFPHGMAPVAEHVHALGLKFGMYMTPGIPVAAYKRNTPIEGTNYHAQDIVLKPLKFATNYNNSLGADNGHVMYRIDFSKPGAQEFLNSWARMLASDGIDYLKLDGIGDSTIADIAGWSKALRSSGRPIHFELSNSLDPARGDVWRRLANGWRISGDVEAYGGRGSFPLTRWSKVYSRFIMEPKFTRWAGPGGWNDLDSLEIGNGSDDGINPNERLSAATLWAISCSPLFLGTDLTRFDKGDMPFLTNEEVLAVNQKGRAGAPLTYNTPLQTWRALEPDGTYAVALFNTGKQPASVGVTWAQLGFAGGATVRDLWTHKDLGKMADGFNDTVDIHAARLLRVTPEMPVTRYLADSPDCVMGGGAVLRDQRVASHGVIAGNLGKSGSLTFNQVHVPTAGTYKVTFLYMDGDAGRSAQVAIDGGAPATIQFPGTGSWDTTGSLTASLVLKAGANAIAITNPQAYAPDIDSIVIQAWK
ncbi:MAG TPA: alpha-galactosidase [Chthoniobacteraceae bacterium]|jgi:hypothetical protein|nr:alpha-galactosidase [Chthoniobacteraceae bacterium]